MKLDPALPNGRGPPEPSTTTSNAGFARSSPQVNREQNNNSHSKRHKRLHALFSFRAFATQISVRLHPRPLGRSAPHQLPCSLMLDLAFVRDHLPLVEEKLRQRGMDPALVLGDFRAIDLDRRSAITKAETMKAQRNKLTEEFQRLRKEKLDTAANLQEQKELKEKIAEAEKIAEEADAQTPRHLNRHPQPS